MMLYLLFGNMEGFPSWIIMPAIAENAFLRMGDAVSVPYIWPAVGMASPTTYLFDWLMYSDGDIPNWAANFLAK